MCVSQLSMASSTTTFSLSLTTFSSSTAYNSQTKTSLLSYRTNENKHVLSSSLFGTKLGVNKVSRPVNLRASGITCSASASSVLPSALLFDCDGVLVDTEKDGHRISFNDTFDEVSSLLFLSCFLIYGG